jgi:hypothetical protein
MLPATEPAEVLSASHCKLCDSPTSLAFNLQIRERFWGRYECCQGCGSLQVRDPSWIGEAYSGPFADEDTGAAQRALYDQMVVSWLYRILSLPRSALLLDFGGGEGLLVRLLRDIGINARFEDTYGSGAFARAFRYEGGEPPQIVTSFEVWEHFVEPSESIKKTFQLKPPYVFISTVLYNGEGLDWWYLAPQSGQHVFFYASEAMQLVARRFGYHVYIFKGTHILFAQRPIKPWQYRALNFVLTRRVRMFLLAALPFYSYRSLDRPAR